MHSPTAVPRMPASASGVSMQRALPKCSWSPAVARKTPPSLPTSSPMTSTDSSRSISTWSASFTASTRRSSATKNPSQLLLLGEERRRRIRIRMLKDERDVRRGLGLGLGDPGAHELERLLPDLLGALVRQHAGANEIPLVPPDALRLPRLLDALQVDVDRRIVRCRMRGGSVGDGLDERRPVAGPRPQHGVARRLVDGEHVAPVNAEAGHPV